MPSDVGLRSGEELAGKVALVTGGARNIGRAIARALAAGGASVMVNAKTSRSEAEKTVAMIGAKADLHIADVTRPEDVQRLVDATMKRFGRLTTRIGLICIAVCLVIAWYGFEVTIQNFVQNEKDVRSLDMPRWMIVGWIPLSFLMMAIEFARFLWRRENFLAPLSDLAGSD